MNEQHLEGGLRRSRTPRTTHPNVVRIDRAATVLITFGGMAVILAVLGILVYLAAVVWPLFSGASLVQEASFPLLSSEEASSVLLAEVDEYRTLGLAILRNGEALTFPGRGGDVARRQLVPPDPAITVLARGGQDRAALGFADGTIRLATFGFKTTFVSESQGGAPEDGSVLEPLPSGGFRRVDATLHVEPPLPIQGRVSPVRLLDLRVNEAAIRLAVMRDDGSLTVSEVTTRRNLLTGAMTSDSASLEIKLPTDRPPEFPSFLLLATSGDHLYVAWPDGELFRWDLREHGSPVLAERCRLLTTRGRRLTVLGLLPGDQSLVAGDSDGQSTIWFRVHAMDAAPDEFRMTPVHHLARSDSAIAVAAVSQRDKTLLTAATDGSLLLHHMTSERLLARTALASHAIPITAQITPKRDGVFVLGSDGTAALYSLTSPHPETSLATLLGPVWYEGYSAPGFTWQSSGGNDEFEPKISLVPLVFGTLKATLYSMLFAVPIALCAAIYTSEFLDRRLRSPVKSAVEMMASLPSVVLGFIAALVLAPFVENWVLSILIAFAVVPLTVLAFGYLWQILPSAITLPLSGKPQFGILIGLVLAAGSVAPMASRVVERALFSGDFKTWLRGGADGAAAGIGMILWPVVLVAILTIDRFWLADRWARRATARGSTGGWSEFGRFSVLVALSFFVAWGAAAAGAALGMDVRGVLLGTYVQRNALVVGFVMGFAVIPLIYTIAEDALAAVPRSLRSASLGCGATRWQTATRIVLPVAASGIFSALMVGLGRAVGETMIVLMAAGNTPLLDMNLFNGLRTLSANIAVELPEAARDGTLYRVLFLSALVLFCLTFVLNTLAEVVRQRFRRRALNL